MAQSETIHSSARLPTAEALLDAREVAALWGIHPETVARMAREGRLPCVRIGSRLVRFRLADIQDFAAPTAAKEKEVMNTTTAAGAG
jgi:excisionase family DNA binding protein